MTLQFVHRPVREFKKPSCVQLSDEEDEEEEEKSLLIVGPKEVVGRGERIEHWTDRLEKHIHI